MMRRLKLVAALLLVLVAAVGVSACGGSSAEADSGAPSGPPNVVGYPLPDAKTKLTDAGYTPVEQAENGVFGIVVESHWTVCSQDDLGDHTVRLNVRKRGC